MGRHLGGYTGRRRGARHIIFFAVVLAHLVVIPRLLESRLVAGPISEGERMWLTFVDMTPRPEDTPPDRATASPSSTRQREAEHANSAITIAPTQVESITGSQIDWLESARRAAASHSVESPGARTFGAHPSPPQARPKPPPFGWDKVHTQRFEALPEGGMLIRLSANCALVLAPLPFAGCGLGKSQARGDLFEGMNQPIEPGDWKDDSRQ